MQYQYPIFKKKEEKKSTQLQDTKTLKKVERVVKISKAEEERLIEQGRKEGLKELAKQEIEEVPKEQALERMQDRELMRVKTVFPFVWFSDELIIEENKLTFIWGVFFLSKNVRSILLKDISNISVETGLLFARINVMDQYFAKDAMSVEYLPKEKALIARRLIQGLIVSTRENIDYADVPKDEIIKHALKLGEADTYVT